MQRLSLRKPGPLSGASGCVFGAVVALGGLLFAPSAQAVPLDFFCITNNIAGDCAIGEAQLGVDVTDAGGGLVSFEFTNTGAAASSIEQVFFDDGVLDAFDSIVNGPGVAFSEDGSPGNLPSGENVNPDFETTFSASADPPPSSNGVNPGEFVEIIFSLDPGAVFNDVLADLTSGDLRIGLHVIAFASDGSESFVNNPPNGGGGPPPPGVPEPAGLLLFAAGLGAVELWRRRRMS